MRNILFDEGKDYWVVKDNIILLFMEIKYRWIFYLMYFWFNNRENALETVNYLKARNAEFRLKEEETINILTGNLEIE